MIDFDFICTLMWQSVFTKDRTLYLPDPNLCYINILYCMSWNHSAISFLFLIGHKIHFLYKQLRQMLWQRSNSRYLTRAHSDICLTCHPFLTDRGKAVTLCFWHEKVRKHKICISSIQAVNTHTQTSVQSSHMLQRQGSNWELGSGCIGRGKCCSFTPTTHTFFPAGPGPFSPQPASLKFRPQLPQHSEVRGLCPVVSW